jgi:glycosyltransferase involved in cell wall biosynthesis
MLKVLFQNRADAFTCWGGDTTQMMETKKQLEKLGVSIDISLEPEPIISGYHLIHIFNIQQADYGIRQLNNAKRQNLPALVSTIFWDTRHISERSALGCLLREVLAATPYSILKVIPGFFSSSFGQRRRRFECAQQMLQKADLLLPNSYAEAEILALLFKAPWVRSKVVVVPNGVNIQYDKTGENKESTEYVAGLPTRYVLQVGRIEPVKGQLRVIAAMMEFPDMPLVFVGRGVDAAYGQNCKRLGEKRGNVHFVGEIAYENIGRYYNSAKVHVLPSLRESPGLVTLEAAIHGANCVVSIHGPVAEYFGPDAWYCDPADTGSIRKAILQAWSSPRNERLIDKILNHFTWEKAAEKTLAAYLSIRPDKDD